MGKGDGPTKGSGSHKASVSFEGWHVNGTLLRQLRSLMPTYNSQQIINLIILLMRGCHLFTEETCFQINFVAKNNLLTSYLNLSTRCKFFCIVIKLLYCIDAPRSLIYYLKIATFLHKKLRYCNLVLFSPLHY